MTFQEKLVILRKSKGLTQDEFASAVGVSRQAVYKWESGQSYPEVPKLLEMKILFTISIDELLDDSYDIPLPEKKKKKRAPKADAPKAAPAAPKAAGATAVKAPMPGNIMKVNAKVGAAVKKGDVLVVLEAMKMENDVCAPADGTVASVEVAQGATVETDAVLVTLN